MTTKKTPKIAFSMCKTDADLKSIYNYDADVFAEAGDFNWSIKSLKKEQSLGWDIYSVTSQESDEIIAALFMKKEGEDLLTKNTSIKLAYQGKGISHEIKNFFEERAKKERLHNVVHFCAVDNFRNIALNESHGYKRIKSLKNGEILKWEKPVK